MTVAQFLRSRHVKPRLIGLLYLIALMATFEACALATSLRDRVSARQTGINFAAHDDRVLWLVLSVLIGAAATTGAVACFDSLFRPVNKRIARTATFFGLVGAVVLATVSVFVLGGRALVIDERFTRGFVASESNALVDVGLTMFFYGVYVAMLFLGIYGVYIGYLTFKSGFAPRLLGIGVALSGLAWATLFAFQFLVGNSAWVLVLRSGFDGPILLSLWFVFIGLEWGDRDVATVATLRDDPGDDPPDGPGDTSVSTAATPASPTENITGRPKLVR